MTQFAFFGTPYVARDTLAALCEAGYTPSVVVTSPPARKGRGLQLQPCETEVFARERDIPVLTPNTLDDAFLSALAAYECSFAIVVAYGKMLPQATIDAFPHGVLNVHYSLLPQYRGASPVETALRNGDSVTGVTIQRMVLAMDAGDILAQREERILDTDTTLSLRPRLIRLGSELLIETLPSLISGSAIATPQDHSLATRASKIAKTEGELALSSQSDDVLWRTYRALAESPGTYFYAHKNTDGVTKRLRVKVYSAQMQNGRFTVDRIIPEGKSELPFTWLEDSGWTPE